MKTREIINRLLALEKAFAEAVGKPDVAADNAETGKKGKPEKGKPEKDAGDDG